MPSPINLSPSPHVSLVRPRPALPDGGRLDVDIAGLAQKIVESSGEERAYQIDILVNLAAGRSRDGVQAQAVLRNLYADPQTDREQEKAEIRESLKQAANCMCQFVLNPPAKYVKERAQHPLSITVAYLGGRCDAPPNGGAVKHLIEAHIGQELAKGGFPPDEGDVFLGNTRLVSQAELMRLPLRNLPLPESGAALKILDSAEQFSATITKITSGMGSGPACKAVWLNSGNNRYDHWMPLILQKDPNGQIHAHVLDTNYSASGSGPALREALRKQLESAGFDDSSIYFTEAAMQANAGNGCGALGHGLLKALDAELGRADSPIAASAEEMDDFIEEHAAKFTSLEVADQEAIVLAQRAELLQARI